MRYHAATKNDINIYIYIYSKYCPNILSGRKKDLEHHVSYANLYICISVDSRAPVLYHFKNIIYIMYACWIIQSCSTLCNLMDYTVPGDFNPPGSSVHGISQARILLWVAIFSSRESSQPRDQTVTNPGIEPACLASPALAGRFLTTWITWDVIYIITPLNGVPGFYNSAKFVLPHASTLTHEIEFLQKNIQYHTVLMTVAL